MQQLNTRVREKIVSAHTASLQHHFAKLLNKLRICKYKAENPLRTYLSFAGEQIAVGGHLFQTHRSAWSEFLCGDTDFGS